MAGTTPIRAARGPCTFERHGKFGPLSLKLVREQIVQLCRTTINKHVDRIKESSGGVLNKNWSTSGSQGPHVSARDWQAEPKSAEQPPSGPSLTQGRSMQRLPYLLADLAGDDQFQRLTGCRPAEVCLVRPRDIETSGAVWSYTPSSHKTSITTMANLYRPSRAQEVIRPFLGRQPDSYCFSPQEATRKSGQGPSEAPASVAIRPPVIGERSPAAARLPSACPKSFESLRTLRPSLSGCGWLRLRLGAKGIVGRRINSDICMGLRSASARIGGQPNRPGS